MSTHQSRLDAVEERLGISFRRPELLLTAITHSSYLEANPDHPVPDYEQLEFFGDTVMDFHVTTALLRLYPDGTPGQLSHYRSALVRWQTLGTIFERLGFFELVLMSEDQRRACSDDEIRLRLLTDVFEAILGALFTDQGPEPVASLLQNLLLAHVEEIVPAIDAADYKTRLQEEVQRRSRALPRYIAGPVTSKEGKSLYHVSLYVNDRLINHGEGPSRRDAEYAAAKQALGTIQFWGNGLPSKNAPQRLVRAPAR